MTRDYEAKLTNLLWEELRALPFGTLTSVDELVERSDAIELQAGGTLKIEGIDGPVDAGTIEDAIEDAVELLFGRAREEGFFFEDGDDMRFALRNYVEAGSAIDYSKLDELHFEVDSYGTIDSRREVSIENGPCGRTLCRAEGFGAKEALPLTPELADRVVRVLDDCNVAAWFRDYQPVGYRVLDGEEWSLKLVFEDGSVFVSGGSNAWPDEYERLEEGLMGLFGEQS